MRIMWNLFIIQLTQHLMELGYQKWTPLCMDRRLCTNAVIFVCIVVADSSTTANYHIIIL